ncbi:Guanine nucleotide exchange factor for Rab-3A [Myotis davidii]|uniref:Guanine nucleotide exchange factor for Rab-3A n=1 Tax=Myotis davidii TaxID=225400 RepID=L5LBP2_MYODS|nr:Guanine nucleotide exchange factor for Rab-3A [Myotis davidii]
MDPPEECTRCPARGRCPVYLAVSSGTVRYAPSGLGPALEGNVGEEPRDTDSQPHPDEGHPPPLEAVPVSWKSAGSCQSRRESPGALAETSAGEGTQGEEGPAAAQLDVSRLRSSSMEIREKGTEFLKEELHKAQKELKLKDEECERLSKVREQLERELEELTASVGTWWGWVLRAAILAGLAGGGGITLGYSRQPSRSGQIDMLQAEVTALKTLVITSTPASPNRELHPQLLSPTKAGPRKGHLRHKSTSSALCPIACPAAGHILTPDKEGKEAASLHRAASGRMPALRRWCWASVEATWARVAAALRPGLPCDSPALEGPRDPLAVVPGQAKAVHLTYEPAWQLPPGERPAAPTSATSLSCSRQVDTTLFAEFRAWRESPTLDKNSPFLGRVYREDVGPCLDFTVQELSALVRAAVEDNTLTIEPVASHTPPTVKTAAAEYGGTNTCALSGLARACRHRIRLGDSDSHYYISPSSRARITAVCNFFTYIRYIQQGLVRQDAESMFWEVTRLRKEMSLAKLGFFPQEA